MEVFYFEWILWKTEKARKRSMSIGTWNVATKAEEVFREIGKFDMDIVRLTETKRKRTEERNDTYISTV